MVNYLVSLQLKMSKNIFLYMMSLKKVNIV